MQFHRDPGFHHAAWGGPGGIVLLLLLVLVAAVLVWAIVRLTQERRMAGMPAAAPGAPHRPDAAIEQARLRYARGELDREAFLRIAADLGAPATGLPAEPPPIPE